MGSYAKLRSGDWGVRVPDSSALCAGNIVHVTTKAGVIKQETVSEIVWRGNGIALCTIEQKQTATRAKSSNNMCESCGDYKAVTTAVDDSGIEGKVCKICKREGRMGISFA